MLSMHENRSSTLICFASRIGRVRTLKSSVSKVARCLQARRRGGGWATRGYPRVNVAEASPAGTQGPAPAALLVSGAQAAGGAIE